MSLPLDSVHRGDYLLMSCGPVVEKYTQMGERILLINHEPEGCIMQVLAVSCPYVLVKVFPVPCEDPEHPYHPPFNVSWNWHDVEFTRPSRQYVREYLKRQGRPPRALRDSIRDRARSLPLPNMFEGPERTR